MKPYLLLLVPIVLFSYIDAEQVCRDGYTMVNNKCLAFMQTPQMYYDAEKTCRFNSGGLVVLSKNAVDNRAVVNFLSVWNVANVFIGLKCSNGDTSTCQWDDLDGLNDYNNFAAGYPLSSQECVILDSQSGKWTSQSCDQPMQYVCELPPTERDCNSNCEVNYNNYCYVRIITPKSFADAENICKKLNSHLTSVLTYLEFRLLAEMYRNQGQYWIGGLCASNDSPIQWLDGSQGEFSFGKTIIDGNCLQYGVDDRSLGTSYYGQNCQGMTPFICKRPASC
ncbi:hypothetical protein GCK72_003838 [Caenorhabditis remanei]|uniref:C-type lectin domain-containing protein n=1 Tax=Caenorhabditis remanei TaxID=31234 RepID=A0A6A5HBW7_CAERE|nr:hypothetical protein GCK72_003838 [Caenorhabditis remanei]KAF1763892.1 hypothetical protein GCK72_003838 [Caenorhabditis remanei]